MASQNICAGNPVDCFYRKVPRMVTKIEHCGNSVKTILVNIANVSKALSRPVSYLTKYFGYELRVVSKLDEETGVALVHGAHDNAKLAGLLENFIKKFVKCHACSNLETEVTISKGEMIQLKCAACGSFSDVDMRDRFSTFILKNLP